MIRDIGVRSRTNRTPLAHLLWALMPLLAGCGIYEHEWTCPMPDGTGKCQSLEQAYAAAVTQSPIPPPIDPTRLAPPPAEADWTPPVKLIWIAPYLDSGGRRHEAALVRVVVFPGSPVTRPEPEFLIPPVPEITEEGSLTTPPSPPPTETGRGIRAPGARPSPGGSRSGGSGGFAIPGS